MYFLNEYSLYEVNEEEKLTLPLVASGQNRLANFLTE